MIRLNQNIARIQRLLRLVIQQDNTPPFEEEVDLLRELVRAENKKHSLKEFFQENISLLAFQVTENAGNTGEHYITTSRKEYWKMLLSASGGGVIVGFLTIIKVLLYYLRVAPFGQAFLYSLNYSTGFIMIHLTHSTLATKQPAMTATNIARSLEVEDSAESVQNLAHLIVRVIRTQFIAFVGNVLVALPVAYLLAAAYFAATGEPIAGEEKALHMVHELHPWHSPALFHAAITGVYLFLAGVISGYYDNKSVYNHIPDRLKKHPLLRKILPSRVLLKLSGYIRYNLGSLAGNFFFGFFLGFTALIGFLLGLPLDIRHITFSSGNFGIALFTLEGALSTEVILASCLGIAGIGFMNFIVSFGLAMTVAIKSRQVHFTHSGRLIRKLWRLFLQHPQDFFFPPKASRLTDIQKEEVNSKTAAEGKSQLRAHKPKEPANH